jgi:hypothetical protein
MSKLGTENILAAGAVWASIMLPSAAFGEDPGHHAAPVDAVELARSPVSGLALGQRSVDRSEFKVRV